MTNQQYPMERSLLGTPKDLDVQFGATKVHRVIVNRRRNLEKYDNYPLPDADTCLVIGAGCSLTIFADLMIDFDKYDAIIITHPMVQHYRHLLKNDRTYVLDMEYQPIGAHYYDEWAEDVRLICRLGKDIETDYKSITWILPDRKYNIHVVGELAPELPYSTGAMAVWIALHKMGGKTKVDMIGIDNDGVVARYWEETRKVINECPGRVKDLAIRLKEYD